MTNALKQAVRFLWKKVFPAFVIVAAFGFVISQVIFGLPELAASDLHFSAPLAVASLLVLLVNFLMACWAWKIVFADLGENATFAEIFAIIFIAQLGRYIPGKIWIFLGQAKAAEGLGFKKSSALSASVIQNLCGTLGAFVLIALCALFSEESKWMFGPAIALVVGGTALFLYAPAMVENKVNQFRARKGAEPVRFTIGKFVLIKLIGIMTLAWAVHCLAFVLLAASMFPIGPAGVFELALVYNLAYLVGFYALIVPGGIGIREGMITAMLTRLLGQGAAGVLALVQRFWYIIAEVIAFAIAWVLYRRLRKQ